ncbi:pyridoxal-phosphate dependent enzyme [Candidatus Bathyarchaeota archaeon]|nr:pyridoxal-phosphate dependent enzyme [Candidatus Bathyarchaeota archaeon]
MNLQDVEEAYRRVEGMANETPVLTSRTIDGMLGCKVFFKCENFQRVGAFKFRGAYNAISQLTPDEKKRGVITHSSGNHAQAVALASTLLDVKAVIVMPENAPSVKVRATKGYGAEVVTCGPNPGDRVATVEPLVEKHDYVLIHPYNDERIVAGAGTAAYELVKEVGELDAIFCPVGGGGLLSGTSIATKGMCPDATVVAVEPANADDAFRSIRDGQIYPSVNPNTIADGLRTSLGTVTFEIIKENVDEIILVSENQIIDAMQLLWERMKIIVEPSGAVPLAGLLSGNASMNLEGKKVGAILSGGNIDLENFFTKLRQKIESS